MASTRPIRRDSQPASVYLLVRVDNARFKLGWSQHPLRRASDLPEFERGELDLIASRAIWLPTRGRAERVERWMHRKLGAFQVAAGHRDDGHREWFAGAVRGRALALLGRVTLGQQGGAFAKVVPLVTPRALVDVAQVEHSPQEVWWRVEDLLTRLAEGHAVAVARPEAADGRFVVTVRALRPAPLRDRGLLRTAALDADSYQCRHEGRLLSFVQTLEWRDDDLVLTFMPLAVVERWPGGLEVAWQVGGFLARLAAGTAGAGPLERAERP